MSIYGVEWTIEYPMKQPDGSVEKTKISIKDRKQNVRLPYLAGRWGCFTTRFDNKPPTSTIFFLYCYLKKDTSVRVKQVIQCTDIELVGNKSSYKDNKENYLQVNLSTGVEDKWTVISVECKI